MSERESGAYEIAVLYEEARRRREEGNCSGAFARYRRLLELAEERGDSRGRAELAAEIGDMYQRMCETVPARHWYEQALSQFEALGSRDAVARMHLSLGGIAQVEGSLTAARERFVAAMETQDRGVSGLARASLGALTLAQGSEAEGMALLCDAYLQLADHPVQRSKARRLLQSAQTQLTAPRFRRLIKRSVMDHEQRSLLFSMFERVIEIETKHENR